MTSSNEAEMNQRYSVIYGDPPWTFRTYSRKGKGRSAESFYDCMSTEAIMRLPVGELAAPDCLLALWTTFPHLRHGLAVLEAWGFSFRTVGFCWVKCRKGAGKAAVPGNGFSVTAWGFTLGPMPRLSCLGRGDARPCFTTTCHS
jgi:N6-adenosine-specific RNA methylase IME4